MGAVMMDAKGTILATAHNQTISKSDPTAHAEIEALRKASAKLQNYRLLSTTLYATVEPCVMCMGAIVHARVQCVVFGASDPKWGAAGSLVQFFRRHPLESPSADHRRGKRRTMPHYDTGFFSITQKNDNLSITTIKELSSVKHRNCRNPVGR